MAKYSKPRRRPKGKERGNMQAAEGHESEDAMKARMEGMHKMPDGEMMSDAEMKGMMKEKEMMKPAKKKKRGKK